MRTVTLLGSTGSIGVQAVDVLERHADRFRVEALASGGSDVVALAAQAASLGAARVGVADASRVGALRDALVERLGSAAAAAVEIVAGPDAASELAGAGSDVVLNGVTGSIGLGPTLAALRGGSTLALANKESLVVGGALVRAHLQRPDQIVPVDSEHSAIAQALRGGSRSEVRRLVLTASGGPFRGWPAEAVRAATPEQALAHPTWSMGPVVTVNSASLMNKGLELIEAHLLFDVPAPDITVVVHPQSVVHSMVEFVDGSTLAQASPPDMRLPIALGLGWPDRLDPVVPGCDWSQASAWTFEPLDESVFPAVRMARDALAASATHPAVYNAANEECVAAFLDRRVGFGDVVATVETVLGEHEGVAADALTLDTLAEVEAWARARARSLLARN
ncbi:1-deoxy-D-xylulose 5-phosphate reductoisomerase [Paraoerskovia sediminicola]|uniref:1-deoxy-D-xylulose 5-phosphate reductoisomerase n=1 Tax=Paraoerskovia sediminicola TaxID=1138587 RepID=A0ABN6XGI4_9CELL|nr:1-deoxy-D-xylulose-5-phosphate reductoisomerase [Paraoerskovia sediminicola]BDZ43929.1 1-deoxy-D-xylulose 5-phosphate reductoisomerase [Paraoerskovia sediminicola]